MRIGIDVRYLSHGLLGGVHTYLANFVPALIDLAANEHQIFLYADTKQPFELSDLPEHVTIRYLPWQSSLTSVYHDFFMKRVLEQDQLDVVHFPANYGFGPANARTIITLHDEINIMPWHEIIRGHPKNLQTATMMTYLHFCTQAALRQARLVITVSEYARRQIGHYSGFDLQKIVPIWHGPSPDLRRIEDAAILEDIRQRHNLNKPFILADALKNPAVLIRAWGRLPRELRTEYEIVFFSRRPDPLPVVHEAASAGIARLLLRPSRADLIGLYSQAKGFVFPSWIEGFGIPVLEAMSCGAPVIVSDRGALPEIAGEAALIMDAEDEAKLAHYLERLLTVPTEAKRLQELGYIRAAQFSWRRTAQQILDSYRQALSM